MASTPDPKDPREHPRRRNRDRLPRSQFRRAHVGLKSSTRTGRHSPKPKQPALGAGCLGFRGGRRALEPRRHLQGGVSGTPSVLLREDPVAGLAGRLSNPDDALVTQLELDK